MSFKNVDFSKKELDDIRVRDVLGDGNCLARALAVTFFGNEELFERVKSLMLQEIEHHYDFYKSFGYSDSELESFLRPLREKRSWLTASHCFFFANSQRVVVNLHGQSTKDNIGSLFI